MKIKICGIRDLAAAEAVAKGADFMGFIMCDRFRRYIPPEQVKEICTAVTRCKKVGVYVDQDAEYVNETAEFCGLDYVQLHGHESAEYARQIKKPIIKAFRYGDDFTVEVANGYPAEIILVDSYSKNKVGGTGIAFAWREAAAEIRKVRKPCMIAGGIKATTVQAAKKIFKPYGVDASGSMEIDGNKSPELIAEFLEATRYERD